MSRNGTRRAAPRGAVALALAASLSVAACGERAPSAAERRVAERLLTPEDLGAGWVDDERSPPLPAPASLDPPCPFDLPPVEFTVEAIDTADLRSEQAMLNVDHMVAVLSGDPAAPATVQRAWAEMDCSGSDTEVTRLDGLPPGTIGLELRPRERQLVQAVVVAVDGDEVALLLVTAADDEAIEVARRLADQV